MHKKCLPSFTQDILVSSVLYFTYTFYLHRLVRRIQRKALCCVFKRCVIDMWIVTWRNIMRHWKQLPALLHHHHRTTKYQYRGSNLSLGYTSGFYTPYLYRWASLIWSCAPSEHDLFITKIIDKSNLSKTQIHPVNIYIYIYKVNKSARIVCIFYIMSFLRVSVVAGNRNGSQTICPRGIRLWHFGLLYLRLGF